MRPYLLAAALAAATCSRPAPPPPEDARAPEPLPRYWLRDAPLLGNPGGREVLHVTGPALVELLPDGRVRAVPGSAVTFEGYLPEELLREPHGTKGLMLYAQRLVELRADHPDRPVIGRLHPGAMVGVAPASEAEGRVGLPVYRWSPTTLLAFTDRTALGLAQRDPPAWKPMGRGRAIVFPLQDFYVGEPRYDRKTSVEVPISDCSDIWLPEGGGAASQYVGGIEITGRLDDTSWWHGPRFLWAHGCKLRAVSRRGEVLVRTGPEQEPEEIAEIPAGYTPTKSDRRYPLSTLISERRAVYWLEATDTGVVCKGWKFDKVSRRDEGLQAELVGDEMVADNNGNLSHPSYPVTFYSRGRQEAVMHLGTRRPVMSADQCDLTLLSESGDELAMTGQEVPEGIVAYDPIDAERWFLTRSRCEAVQSEVNAAIEADGSVATRLGIHIPMQ